MLVAKGLVIFGVLLIVGILVYLVIGKDQELKRFLTNQQIKQQINQKKKKHKVFKIKLNRLCKK